MVEEVELVHATPQYAHIRFPSGRETTVPLSDVAPAGGAASGYSPDADPGSASDTVCHHSRSFRLSIGSTSRGGQIIFNDFKQDCNDQDACNIREKYVRVKPALNLVLLRRPSAQPRRSSSQRTPVEIGPVPYWWYVFRGNDCGGVCYLIVIGPLINLACFPDCYPNCGWLFWASSFFY